MKIIDVHCHLFNLKYLPVAGILRRYTNDKIPHLVARGIEWLFIRRTKSDFENQIQNDDGNLRSLQEELGLISFDYSIKDIISFTEGEVQKAIEAMPVKEDLKPATALYIAIEEFVKREGTKEEREDFSHIKETFITNDQEAFLKIFGWFKRLINWIIDEFKQIVNYLKWFIFMTNNEEKMYDHIANVDEQKADKFLHLMMDVDHFFNVDPANLIYKSYFDFEQAQVTNMQRLNAAYDKLIGFVAFNPARPGSLELVKKAIRDKGFKGVKFYPPMGYQPFGDEVYEKEVDELMSYCNTDRVPLFTHCNNQGFEAYPKDHSGYCSNPKYWEKVLEKYPDLILCLGHAGGTEGWFAKNRSSDKIEANKIESSCVKNASLLQKEWNLSYAALVFKLCVEKKFVYCDASYLDDMVNSGGGFDPVPKERFKKRLLKLFGSETGFSKKIMYGSDWHMLFQEAKNGVYLSTYLEFFAEPEFDNYREDFFYNNAARYLQLVK